MSKAEKTNTDAFLLQAVAQRLLSICLLSVKGELGRANKIVSYKLIESRDKQKEQLAIGLIRGVGKVEVK